MTRQRAAGARADADGRAIDGIVRNRPGQGRREPFLRSIAAGWVSAVALGLLAGSSLMPLRAEAQTQTRSQTTPPQTSSGLVSPFSDLRWSGWVQGDAAYTWPESGHFSHLRMRAELAAQGNWGTGLKWKVSARGHYDAAYDLSDLYPPSVKRDQRSDLALHEAYVDFSRGDWEFRLGKQNIVWGEMVGLFFADVVSAKDLREFVLPEFDLIRIPQWAARAEWYAGDSHLELIWVLPEVDRIGKPGGEFYPWPFRYDGLGYEIIGEERPSRSLSNTGIGARVSTLVGGWDLTAFVYRAPDSQAAFHRSIGLDATGAPKVVYQARHDRLTRLGGTVSKDFDGIVAKAEVVYSRDRTFGIAELDPGDGVVSLDTIDWAASLDLTPIDDWRVNVQLYQRAFLDHDERTGMKHRENGASLLLSHAIDARLDGEFLAISSLTRSDRLLRASLIWKYDSNIRVRGGIDVFAGNPYGMFGRFDDSDRIWAELRYSF